MILAAPRSMDVRRLLVAAPLALALVSSMPALAQDRGSPADQDACTPDVFRLCNDAIPDEKLIVACLQSKREQLSPACGQVFAPEKARRHRHH